MPSKNLSLARNNLQKHIDEIIELNGPYEVQKQQIESMVVTREGVLQTTIDGFKRYMLEYEKDQPRVEQWHKTVKAAEKCLNRK